jgi:hypothetical protein
MIMERKFLIFGLYEKDDNDIFAMQEIWHGDFPTKPEAEEYMQSISFSKLKGITGIVEVFNDHGWD